MDKQLIFRLRQCADASSDWIGDSLRDIANQLERIDAERGKDAVGYIDSSQLDRWNRLRGTEFEVAERCYMPWGATPFKSDISDCSTPVFLSPTIPEGMALVPPEKPLPDLMLASYHEAIGWNACREAMIAAAQGEK